MKLDDLRASADAIENGGWVETPEMMGLRLKVRGIGSRAWRVKARELERLLTPAERRSVGVLEAVSDAVMVEVGLMDWDGLTDNFENPVPFSRELAAELIQAGGLFRDMAYIAVNMVGRQAHEGAGAPAAQVGGSGAAGEA